MQTRGVKASARGVRTLNDIPCICPNNPLLQMIQSQPIRPGANFHVLKHNVPTSSAHGRRLDSGERGVPVGPEEDPWWRNPKRQQLVLITVCLLLQGIAAINLMWFSFQNKRDVWHFNISLHCKHTNAALTVCINRQWWWWLPKNSPSDPVQPSTSVTGLEMADHLFYYYFSQLNEAWKWTVSYSNPAHITSVLTWSTKSAGERQRKWVFRLKSSPDDNRNSVGKKYPCPDQ